MSAIKIGLFDDHPMSARGLADFISTQNFEVVFGCDNKSDLLYNLNTLEVDVLILDIIAPDVMGLELFEEILKSIPALKVIAYSSLSSIMLVENLLSIGVKGFVNKKQNPQDIIDCIEKVIENDISIPSEYHFLTSKYHSLNTTVLSSREIEIIDLIAKEFTSAEIAEKLSISPFTVENHRKTIFKKLEVKNLAGMIIAATRLGYLS